MINIYARVRIRIRIRLIIHHLFVIRTYARIHTMHITQTDDLHFQRVYMLNLKQFISRFVHITPQFVSIDFMTTDEMQTRIN